MTEDSMGRHVQEYSSSTTVKKGQKSLRMAYTYTTHVEAISLGVDHLVIKQSSSPWSHQEAVSLMGLIRFIYLFVYKRVPATQLPAGNDALFPATSS